MPPSGMRARFVVPPTVHTRLARQKGVITRAQALALGVSVDSLNGLLRRGTWHRMAAGLYCADPEPSWDQWLRAGALWAGEPCAIGGEAAAFQQGLVRDSPALIDIWVPVADSHRRPLARWRLHGDRYGRLELSGGNPAFTRIEDTVFDVAWRSDEAHAVAVLTRALASRRTDEQCLRQVMARRSRVRHKGLLTELTAEHHGYESVLEYFGDVKVLVPHGLPRGRTQVNTVAWIRVDRLIEEYRLVLEFDGRQGHEGDGRFRDMARDNANTELFLRTIRLGWQAVTQQPCETARLIARVLRQQGWDGPFTECPRCGASDSGP